MQIKTACPKWILGNMFFVKYFLLPTWLLNLPLKYFPAFSLRKIFRVTFFYHYIWQKFNTFSTCHFTFSIQRFTFTKIPTLFLTNLYPLVAIKFMQFPLYLTKFMVINLEKYFLFPLLILYLFGALSPYNVRDYTIFAWECVRLDCM